MTDFISSCAATSPFCLASLIAATIKSSVISLSSGFSKLTSRFILFISPFAVAITFTTPPPDTPSTSMEFNFSCASADAQEKLNSIEVEGVSGGGVVKVIATAKGEIKRINLDVSLLKPEDKEITEDLIVAAINDAKQKGEVAAQEEMKSVTGGLPLPPGMKLPF